jgi:hypothetical protein
MGIIAPTPIFPERREIGAHAPAPDFPKTRGMEELARRKTRRKIALTPQVYRDG